MTVSCIMLLYICKAFSYLIGDIVEHVGQPDSAFFRNEFRPVVSRCPESGDEKNVFYNFDNIFLKQLSLIISHQFKTQMSVSK
jgi:hypothetical protein